MNAKLKKLPVARIDPDDAPELTDDMLAVGVYRVDGNVVPDDEGRAAMRAVIRRGRPAGSRNATRKEQVAVRYSPDVLAAFRATGKGWQTRMDDALKDWLKRHSSA
jgi:uncharacterized protein (DUF4415 family)